MKRFWEESERYCDSQVDPSFYERVYRKARVVAWVSVVVLLLVAAGVRELVVQ